MVNPFGSQITLKYLLTFSIVFTTLNILLIDFHLMISKVVIKFYHLSGRYSNSIILAYRDIETS